MELVKLPVPVPSVVLLFAVVGLGDVLQQTPLPVTGEPPLLVTLPPLDALFEAMELTPVVVTVGSMVEVVKVRSSP